MKNTNNKKLLENITLIIRKQEIRHFETILIYESLLLILVFVILILVSSTLLSIILSAVQVLQIFIIISTYYKYSVSKKSIK